jgi:hypothetical protein
MCVYRIHLEIGSGWTLVRPSDDASAPRLQAVPIRIEYALVPSGVSWGTPPPPWRYETREEAIRSAGFYLAAHPNVRRVAVQEMIYRDEREENPPIPPDRDNRRRRRDDARQRDASR